MKKTTAGRIVRATMKLWGKGSVMFNDKTKTGRSIKVWHWSLEDYCRMKEILKAVGYKVTVKKYLLSDYSGRYYLRKLGVRRVGYRLYVED